MSDLLNVRAIRKICGYLAADPFQIILDEQPGWWAPLTQEPTQDQCSIIQDQLRRYIDDCEEVVVRVEQMNGSWGFRCSPPS
jgi:hypothetical protein